MGGLPYGECDCFSMYIYYEQGRRGSITILFRFVDKSISKAAREIYRSENRNKSLKFKN